MPGGQDIMILVDSVSGLSGARIEMDAWDLDVVLAASETRGVEAGQAGPWKIGKAQRAQERAIDSQVDERGLSVPRGAPVLQTGDHDQLLAERAAPGVPRRSPPRGGRPSHAPNCAADAAEARSIASGQLGQRRRDGGPLSLIHISEPTRPY